MQDKPPFITSIKMYILSIISFHIFLNLIHQQKNINNGFNKIDSK